MRAAALNKALAYLATSKRPISAARVKEAAKEAQAQVKEYKRVVHAVEKFLKHAKPQQRLGVVYLIDSLCKSSGRPPSAGAKDSGLVFAARFGQRMRGETLPKLREVPSSDRPAVERVVANWHTRGLFGLSEADMVVPSRSSSSNSKASRSSSAKKSRSAADPWESGGLSSPSAEVLAQVAASTHSSSHRRPARTSSASSTKRATPPVKKKETPPATGQDDALYDELLAEYPDEDYGYAAVPPPPMEEGKTDTSAGGGSGSPSLQALSSVDVSAPSTAAAVSSAAAALTATQAQVPPPPPASAAGADKQADKPPPPPPEPQYSPTAAVDQQYASTPQAVLQQHQYAPQAAQYGQYTPTPGYAAQNFAPQGYGQQAYGGYPPQQQAYPPGYNPAFAQSGASGSWGQVPPPPPLLPMASPPSADPEVKPLAEVAHNDSAADVFKKITDGNFSEGSLDPEDEDMDMDDGDGFEEPAKRQKTE
ncbi:hypothetical protein JKP88DRAFT_302671 [Tribonema minus]|uniref:CID domain-containing protein n=1 Tax=Tribonema minus TaxID=303371 RepID=A0A835ZBE3_9STRA|nr:hypothetical protein JKP88DRAFT_302671 [Tribonema minus]